MTKKKVSNRKSKRKLKPLAALSQLKITGGPKNLSEDIDVYLYGRLRPPASS